MFGRRAGIGWNIHQKFILNKKKLKSGFKNLIQIWAQCLTGKLNRICIYVRRKRKLWIGFWIYVQQWKKGAMRANFATAHVSPRRSSGRYIMLPGTYTQEILMLILFKDKCKFSNQIKGFKFTTSKLMIHLKVMEISEEYWAGCRVTI